MFGVCHIGLCRVIHNKQSSISEDFFMGSKQDIMYSTIRALLENTMRVRNIKKTDLAKMSGVSNAQLREILKANPNIGFDKYQRVFSALGIDFFKQEDGDSTSYEGVGLRKFVLDRTS